MPSAPPSAITPSRLLPIPAATPWVQRLTVRVLPDRINFKPAGGPDLSAFQWPMIWSLSLVFAAGFFGYYLLPWSLGSMRMPLEVAVALAAGGVWIAGWFIRAWIVSRRQRRAGPIIVVRRQRGGFGGIDVPRWRLKLKRDQIVAFQFIRGVVADSADRKQWTMRIEQLTLVYLDDNGVPIRRLLCSTQPSFRREVTTWLQTFAGAEVHVCDLSGPPAIFRTLRRHEPLDSLVFAEPAETPEAALAAGHSQRPLVCPKCGYPVHGLPGNRCPECGTLIG